MTTQRRPALSVALSVLALFLTRTVGIVVSYAMLALLSTRFGASSVTDTFLFARGSISRVTESLGFVIRGAYVPAIVKFLKEPGRDAAAAVLRRHALWIGVVALLTAAVVALLAPLAVKVLAPGFVGPTADLAARVLRVLAFVLPAALVLALVTALLNARSRFGAPALLGELLPTAVLCVVLIFFVPPVGGVGLAVALLLGTVGALILLLVSARRPARAVAGEFASGGRLTIDLSGRVVPILLTAAIGNLLMQVDVFFASRLAEGSVSVLEFGNRLVQIPRVLTGSMAIVLLSELSHRFAQEGVEGMRALLVRAQRAGLALVLPAGAILMACSDPMVDVLLRWGEFDAEQAAVTARVMRFACPAVMLSIVITLLNTAILVDETAPRLRVFGTTAVVALVCRVVGDVVLTERMGVVGLALAFSLTNVVQATILALLLRRHWGAYLSRKDIVFCGLLLVSFVLSVAAMVGLLSVWDIAGDGGVLLRFARLVTVAAVGLGVLFTVARTLRIAEVSNLRALLRGRSSG